MQALNASQHQENSGDEENPHSQDVNPMQALPAWATDALDDSSDEDDDTPECHICCMTAEDKGEDLVVPCLCVSMPVHPTCLEAWRMQCRNPDSARKCPNCRQQYHTGGTPRADSDSAALNFVSGVTSDGRVGVAMRRHAFRAQENLDAGCLPPLDAAPGMRKNVIFCFWVAVLWGVCWASAEVLLLLLRRMAFGSKYTSSVINMCWYIACISSCTSLLGLWAARFRKWLFLKLYIYGLTMQLLVGMTIGTVVVIMTLAGGLPFNFEMVCLAIVSFSAVVQPILGLIFVAPVHEQLDPHRVSSARRQAAVRARRERRERQQARRDQRGRGRGAAAGLADPFLVTDATFAAAVEPPCDFDSARNDAFRPSIGFTVPGAS